MDRAVISVNIGNHDNIIEEHYPNPDWDFVMFTDSPLKSKFWRIIQVEYYPDKRRHSRLYKWLIHKYCDVEYSLYIDASVKILTDLNLLIEKYLRDADIAMYRHRIRDCLYEEGEVCIYYKLDDPKTINEQLGRYKNAGYPIKAGLNECEVILRRHTPQITKLNEIVWSEISNGSYRDQLTFNYAVWKLGIKVNNFDGMIKLYPEAKRVIENYLGKIEYINPYFELKEHRCV